MQDGFHQVPIATAICASRSTPVTFPPDCAKVGEETLISSTVDTMKKEELAKMIDHTVLKPDTTMLDVKRVCNEALQHGFGCVCVAPTWLHLAVKTLAGTGVRVGTVTGFPHGDTLTVVKCVEASTVLEAGADEVDMVIPVGKLKSDETEVVQMDIAFIADLVHRKRGALLKVILETPLLTDDEIKLGCHLAEQAGADFVKTATGYAGGGATVEAVALMREIVGDRLGVKAAGGIRDFEAAKAMIEAGATRIGASGSVNIMATFRE
jgi:deoxyribose-phosphate aldolase